MTIQNEILHFEKLIYVSIKMKQKVMKKHHELRKYEHLKIVKIMEHIRRIYYFLDMNKLIEKKTTICLFCN